MGLAKNLTKVKTYAFIIISNTLAQVNKSLQTYTAIL